MNINNDKNLPLVSVCVQTYNHEKYIAQCLDSILAQKTNFDFEIIVGEDESSDSTRDICIKYQNKHPKKIKLFLRKRTDVIYIHGKPTGRYNFIQNLKSSQGKYIALCPGDDFWTDPFKLQKQVDFLESNESYVLCGTNAQYRYENNTTSQELVHQKNIMMNYTFSNFKTSNHLITATVMFKNMNFDFPVEFHKAPFGDWFLYAFLLKKSLGKAIELDINTAAYRVHHGGIFSSAKQIKRSLGHLQQVYLITSLYENQGDAIHSFLKYSLQKINETKGLKNKTRLLLLSIKLIFFLLIKWIKK